MFCFNFRFELAFRCTKSTKKCHHCCEENLLIRFDEKFTYITECFSWRRFYKLYFVLQHWTGTWISLLNFISTVVDLFCIWFRSNKMVYIVRQNSQNNPPCSREWFTWFTTDLFSFDRAFVLYDLDYLSCRHSSIRSNLAHVNFHQFF